ncbi:MAG TPA: riboflavin synthase [Granulicella sp.]|jgi:riboflavin synthase|nr:riboflavin synthase [Granulicella sp.]
MFTGLIETTGTLLARTRSGGGTRITIAAPTLTARLNQGDSIAVNGVCLTALDIEPNAFPPRFSADLAAETLARTTLAHLKDGAVVNLELPTPAGSPLGGHIVQGHIDGTATLLSLAPVTPDASHTDWRLRLELPEPLLHYVVPQGSITVEGISLTVAALRDRIVEIAIIPHTYAATSLQNLRPGAQLNIEVDVLAKYAERQPPPPPRPTLTSPLTEQYLIANGY